MPRRRITKEAPLAPLSSSPVQADIAPSFVSDPAMASLMTAGDRENPAKLAGEALKRLAYDSGISRSECDRSSDEQLRRQMQHIIYRRYDEEYGVA